jgi:hypothetical protein
VAGEVGGASGAEGPGAAPVPLIVARERAEAPHFLAVRAAVPPGSPPVEPSELPALALPAEARDALQVAPGDEIAYLPLS